MKERGIIMQGHSVRAILECRKTMTRRAVKLNESGRVARGGRQWHIDDPAAVLACPYGQASEKLWVRETWQQVHPLQIDDARYSQPGYAGIPGPPPVHYRTIYRADGEYPAIYSLGGEPWPYRSLDPFERNGTQAFVDEPSWTPSIYMPRWACRLVLEIIAVRVERLQAGEGEVDWESRYLAEGINRIHHGDGEYYYSAFREEPHPKNWGDPFDAWRELWISINGQSSWDANPYVWVIEFKRVTP